MHQNKFSCLTSNLIPAIKTFHTSVDSNFKAAQFECSNEVVHKNKTDNVTFSVVLTFFVFLTLSRASEASKKFFLNKI